jgi:hypothetical protein
MDGTPQLRERLAAATQSGEGDGRCVEPRSGEGSCANRERPLTRALEGKCASARPLLNPQPTGAACGVSRALTVAKRKAGETSHRKVRSQPCVSFRSLPCSCASRISSAHVVVPAAVPRRHPRRNVNLSTKSIFFALLPEANRMVPTIPAEASVCGHVIPRRGPGSGNCVQGSHCRTGKNNFVFVAFLPTSYTTVLNDVIHRSIAPSPGFHVLVARLFRVPPRRTASYS